MNANVCDEVQDGHRRQRREPPPLVDLGLFETETERGRRSRDGKTRPSERGNRARARTRHHMICIYVEKSYTTTSVTKCQRW